MTPVSSLRAPTALVVLLATLLSLAACSPAPDATPSPTATPLFATEKEAFAAAEATFDSYVQALNSVDTTDPHTFEPVFELSSGSVETADRKNFSEWHADRMVLTGAARVVSFTGVESRPPFTKATAAVCLDVSAVQITNRDGSSGVSPTRPSVYGIEVELVVSGGSAYTVDKATPSESVKC